MNYKQINVAISIIRNHFRMLKNRLVFGDNNIALLFLIILFLLFIPPFSIYFGAQSSINSQIVSILFTLILPIVFASKYLIFITKEDSILLVMFNKKDLYFLKQLLISSFTLLIFGFMLLFGIIPHFGNIPNSIIILTEILLLLIFSWSLPYISLKINFKVNVSKSTRYWNYPISNIRTLPVRGIILREFLNLWRENKKNIIRIFIKAILINILLVFFIVNNGKEDLLIWVLYVQNIIFLSFIINYSALNNIKLMKLKMCNPFYILKGEFVFWLILFLIYFTFIVIIYNSILSQLAVFPIVTAVLLFIVSLLYVLLVRLAYSENGIVRTIIFYMMFIPITIPYYIYKSYRRLKC